MNDSTSSVPDPEIAVRRQQLAAFMEERRPQLLAYIERRLGDALRAKVEPQDIFQEMAMQALGTGEVPNVPEEAWFSWLCQAAERRIIDAHRRYFGAQKRAAGRELSIDAPSGDTSNRGLVECLAASFTTASQALSRAEREMRLQAAIESLPSDARDALRLRYVDNLPTKEIAVRMGKTDGAIRVLLSRTVNKLQELLQGTEEEEQP